MKSQLREQAVQLRIEKNLSYTEIRKKLCVAKSTLSRWLQDFPLSEEKIKDLQRQGWSKSETSIERFRATMRKKKEFKYQEAYREQQKKLVNLSSDTFFVAGLMLYLGEGDKKNPNIVGLANTDSWTIKFFIKWLVDFFNIPKEKIKAQLHLYENMDIRKEKEFWRNELRFQESQFYKPEIRILKEASFSYRESYRHGTCTVRVNTVDKKRELMAAIQAFLDLYEQTSIMRA